MNMDLLLQSISKHIGISKSDAEEAEKSYQALINWLAKGFFTKNVVAFPQGSLALGTSIKPINDNSEYDLDIVCGFPFDDFETAEKLKLAVGKRFKEHAIYKKIMQPEGRRCWTFQYNNFHIDLLPAIVFRNKKQPIWATDKDKTNDTYSWISTNPKGFIEWFLSRDSLLDSAVSRKLDAEPVPAYIQHTKCQMLVRLLKRHRDVFFNRAPAFEKKDIPISIIITTLVGEEFHPAETLQDFLYRIPSAMQKRIQNSTVRNPVDPRENFADKWSYHPEKRKCFEKWLRQLHEDVEQLQTHQNPLIILERMFGDKTMRQVMSSEAESVKKSLKLKNSAALSSKTSSVSVQPHTFYGVDNETIK